jgi:hypothetical protein
MIHPNVANLADVAFVSRLATRDPLDLAPGQRTPNAERQLSSDLRNASHSSSNHVGAH